MKGVFTRVFLLEQIHIGFAAGEAARRGPFEKGRPLPFVYDLIYSGLLEPERLQRKLFHLLTRKPLFQSVWLVEEQRSLATTQLLLKLV